jgi:hypothetical protein
MMSSRRTARATSSREADPPWVPGMRGRPYLDGYRWVLPEWVLFDPHDVFDLQGFASGRLLEGVLDVWRRRQPPLDELAPHLLESYRSPAVLLHETLRRHVLPRVEAGSFDYDGYAHNRAARLIGVPSAAGCLLSGRCHCARARVPDLGPEVAVHTGQLLHLCDELFPDRSGPWLELNRALVHLAPSLAHAAVTGTSDWLSQFPDLSVAFALLDDGRLLSGSLAARLCDALCERFELDDDACTLAARLLPATRGEPQAALAAVAAAAAATHR